MNGRFHRRRIQADLLGAVDEDAGGFFLPMPEGRGPLPRALARRVSEGD